MIAKNRCSNCQHEWQDRPAGFAVQYSCPRCSSPYWVWVNYDELTGERQKDENLSS